MRSTLRRHIDDAVEHRDPSSLDAAIVELRRSPDPALARAAVTAAVSIEPEPRPEHVARIGRCLPLLGARERILLVHAALLDEPVITDADRAAVARYAGVGAQRPPVALPASWLARESVSFDESVYPELRLHRRTPNDRFHGVRAGLASAPLRWAVLAALCRGELVAALDAVLAAIIDYPGSTRGAVVACTRADRRPPHSGAREVHLAVSHLLRVWGRWRATAPQPDDGPHSAPRIRGSELSTRISVHARFWHSLATWLPRLSSRLLSDGVARAPMVDSRPLWSVLLRHRRALSSAAASRLERCIEDALREPPPSHAHRGLGLALVIDLSARLGCAAASSRVGLGAHGSLAAAGGAVRLRRSLPADEMNRWVRMAQHPDPAWRLAATWPWAGWEDVNPWPSLARVHDALLDQGGSWAARCRHEGWGVAATALDRALA